MQRTVPWALGRQSPDLRFLIVKKSRKTDTMTRPKNCSRTCGRSSAQKTAAERADAAEKKTRAGRSVTRHQGTGLAARDHQGTALAAGADENIRELGGREPRARVGARGLARVWNHTLGTE